MLAARNRLTDHDTSGRLLAGRRSRLGRDRWCDIGGTRVAARSATSWYIASGRGWHGDGGRVTDQARICPPMAVRIGQEEAGAKEAYGEPARRLCQQVCVLTTGQKTGHTTSGAATEAAHPTLILLSEDNSNKKDRNDNVNGQDDRE